MINRKVQRRTRFWICIELCLLSGNFLEVTQENHVKSKTELPVCESREEILTCRIQNADTDISRNSPICLS
jgi:hypothetical protein